MPTYVCMLRGINVGGHNPVSMADLKQVFVDLGYRDAQTYVQSGNVIFSSPDEPVHQTIERHIADGLGAVVTAMIRSHEELAEVVAANPFIDADTSTLHVTFLIFAPRPPVAAAVPAAAGAPDEFRIAGREVYLHCPNGYGRTKLNNTFWERRLRTAATTRNWNSVTKLTELSA